jgi:hypothetical protein
MNYFFVVGCDIQMEISELILSHHFFDQMCAHQKKKTQSLTAKETETS